MQRFNLEFDPLIPWGVLIAAALVAAVVVGLLLLARQRGSWLRVAGVALILLSLANPALLDEERDRLEDVVALLVDQSPSQSVQDRTEQTEKARAAIEAQLKARPRTQVRIVETGRDANADGTRLFDALQASLADVAPERLAGVIAITDGQVHDVPASLKAIGIGAPFHALITGHVDERDRRIELLETPRFGIVGKSQTIILKMMETGASMGPANLIAKRDGEVIFQGVATPGTPVRVPVKIEHGGPNLVELEIEGAPNELTLVNNRAVVTIDGVRDKLKVLLVSGEPHAGERTWRNLLKSDANLELVHFTILRPPDKQDGTPVNELSLIAFPHRDLFGDKIKEFDLIIFDRYSVNQSIMPMFYLDNIARYVREGGAVLLASGPEFAQAGSLSGTPLGGVIPVRATGRILEKSFRAEITMLGKRHPVTRDLPGGDVSPPTWSPWLRLIGAEKKAGTAVMAGPADAPLLLLSRENKGRVAVFLSDHAWLWARGYGEGGPYIDLLRHLAHWLMKEPELEEEALRLKARGNELVIERQTLADTIGDVTLTGPDGAPVTLTLSGAEPGLWRASYVARQQGLWRVSDGTLNAVAIVGPANPREFRDMASTETVLAGIAAETGGSVRRLATTAGFTIPRLVDIRAGSGFAGSDYIGLKPGEASVVRAISLLGLTTGLLGLVLLLGGALVTWLHEGRTNARTPAS